MPIFTVARPRPMVRMNSAMRCFWSAKTCSTADRTAERARLARWCDPGIGCPFGLRKCTMLRRFAAAMAASLAFE
ncbi:hypothetical protein TSA6c_36625 [Azospirillum sp. TSA6c]|nr:hypothetical protein TSA6c_36625 [Azospirillum sp. TSA6c]